MKWEVFERPARDVVVELNGDGERRERAATKDEEKTYDETVAEFERIDREGVARIEGGTK